MNEGERFVGGFKFMGEKKGGGNISLDIISPPPPFLKFFPHCGIPPRSMIFFFLFSFSCKSPYPFNPPPPPEKPFKKSAFHLENNIYTMWGGAL